jgi:ATP-dependent RNA helicase MSS116
MFIFLFFSKTLAFLIPSVERISLLPKVNDGISILVLAPTRELAIQIAAEARVLVQFHEGYNVEVFVGGTKINKDQSVLRSGAITILVATPGRLIDHLDNTPKFSAALKKVQVVVVDEADRLLDMGFKPNIDKIFSHLPAAHARQTLLFSATVPSSVTAIAKKTLKPGYVSIDTTGLADDDSGATHAHVYQELVVSPFSDIIHTVGAALTKEINRIGDGYKIIVFFPTAKTTGFMAQLFAASGLDIIEMHSRKPQKYRENASAKFRAGKNMIMFSSDVSARGMDYPGVNFVLQVGVTDKEQYIHRLGRTARAGAEGKGMIIVADFEEALMRKELKDVPLNALPLENLSALDESRKQYTAVLQKALKNPSFVLSGEQAYRAWLGFYNQHSNKLGLTKEELVQLANKFASDVMLLPQQPSFEARTVGKMGMKGVAGLTIMSAEKAAAKNAPPRRR